VITGHETSVIERNGTRLVAMRDLEKQPITAAELAERRRWEIAYSSRLRQAYWCARNAGVERP
jgi:hypothetical protein